MRETPRELTCPQCGSPEHHYVLPQLDVPGYYVCATPAPPAAGEPASLMQSLHEADEQAKALPKWATDITAAHAAQYDTPATLPESSIVVAHGSNALRRRVMLSFNTHFPWQADASLIAHAPDDLAWLMERLATAEARVRELEADAERLTKLQRLIAPNPEQGHGADVMLYGRPRGVGIGYGAWHATLDDVHPSEYATATDLRAAIDLIPDESAARASHQGGAET